jgi:hypothetical protein
LLPQRGRALVRRVYPRLPSQPTAEMCQRDPAIDRHGAVVKLEIAIQDVLDLLGQRNGEKLVDRHRLPAVHLFDDDAIEREGLPFRVASHLAAEYLVAGARNDGERLMDETWLNPELDQSGLEVSGDSIKVDVGEPVVFHETRVRCLEIAPRVFVRAPEGHSHESDLLLDLGGHVDPGKERSSKRVRHDLVVEQVDRGNDGRFAADPPVKGFSGELFHVTISITDSDRLETLIWASPTQSSTRRQPSGVHSRWRRTSQWPRESRSVSWVS